MQREGFEKNSSKKSWLAIDGKKGRTSFLLFLNLDQNQKKLSSSTPDIDWDSLSFGIENCAPVSRLGGRAGGV